MRPDKPDKPYPEFPLTAAPNGTWVKKIKGKLHTFGGWRDPDGALAEYLRQKDYLQAGKAAPPKDAPEEPQGLTLLDLINQFMDAKQVRVDMGKMTPRQLIDYQRSCKRVAEIMGRHTLVEGLKTRDFDLLALKLSDGVGKTTYANRFRLARALFLYASANDLIPKRLNFGQNFTLPDKAEMRVEKQKRGPMDFTAEELRKIIDAVGVPLKAMVLLGINCGFGNHDCATLPREAVNLDAGWINFPRPKTAVERRCPLWPETVTALREALGKRRTPTDETNSGLMFITKYGQPYTRLSDKGTNLDAVAGEFAKILKSLKLNGRRRAFYSLRRTFETIGGDSRDQIAVNAIMGHAEASDDMASVYRQRIEDARLVAVTDYVRAWLWPKPVNENTPQEAVG